MRTLRRRWSALAAAAASESVQRRKSAEKKESSRTGEREETLRSLCTRQAELGSALRENLISFGILWPESARQLGFRLRANRCVFVLCGWLAKDQEERKSERRRERPKLGHLLAGRPVEERSLASELI